MHVQSSSTILHDVCVCPDGIMRNGGLMLYMGSRETIRLPCDSFIAFLLRTSESLKIISFDLYSTAYALIINLRVSMINM